MANVAKIKEVFGLIDAKYEKDPESFNMGTWGRKTECGTQMCVAGYAVYAEGYMRYVKEELEIETDKGAIFHVTHKARVNKKGLQLLKEIDPEYYDSSVKGFHRDDVDWDHVFFRLGAHILELDDVDAGLIFYATTIDTPEEMKSRFNRVLGQKIFSDVPSVDVDAGVVDYDYLA